MCRNLARKSGRPVIGYDVVSERIADCAGAGVGAAASISGVVTRADVVFICVPGEPQVRQVCFGPDGLIAHARAGQTVVDMSTATVEVDREVAAALAEKGAGFADAPVARGVPAAENGSLAITVGASGEVLARIDPYLRCMGTDVSHCGGVGNGQVMKLMNNMLLFQTVSALAETMAIATRAGVDRSKVFEILSRGSADSYAMRKHGACMTSGATTRRSVSDHVLVEGPALCARSGRAHGGGMRGARSSWRNDSSRRSARDTGICTAP